MVYCRRRDRGRQLWLLLLLLAGGGYLCLVLRSNGGASSAGVGGTELWHRRGEAPAGSRPGFYHGAIGLQADNTPAWQPQNYVRATSEDTQAELKEHGFHLRVSLAPTPGSTSRSMFKRLETPFKLPTGLAV